MIQPGTHFVDPASLWVDREKRQRKELTGIEDLAQSIASRGLIHPPVVTRDLEVIAGERRWTAIKFLGWDQMEVRYTDEVPLSELHMIELEENIKRVDISWQEQVLAIEKWHSLKLAEDPSWNQAETAKELGVSNQSVSEAVTLATEIKAGNERIASAAGKKTAINIQQRDTKRKQQSVLAAIEGKTEEKRIPLINADFHEWAAAHTGIKFNFLHCDFPYGINANKQQQGTNITAHGGYEDGKDIYFALLDTLEMAMSNVVADHAHLIFWFSMDYYQLTVDRLTAMGWRVNPFPLIWHKNDNTGLLPAPQRGPRRVYETALFASRGDRLIVSAVSNAVGHPGKDKEIHMSEKPEGMLQHFFRMVVDESTVGLDPTAGSANALKVMEKLGANYVLGLEKDPTFYARSVAAYFADGGYEIPF